MAHPGPAINIIEIERKLPIINGFLQIPDGQITLRNKLTKEEAEAAIPGSSVTQVSGNMRTDREWFVLPAFDREDGVLNDFFQSLRDAAD